jgi:hypothetical protein
MQNIFLLLLFIAGVFATGYIGSAGLNPGTETYTGSDANYATVNFNSYQLNDNGNNLYSVLQQFGEETYYGITLTQGGEAIVGLNASITTNCVGSMYGEAQIVRYSGGSRFVIASWPSTSGTRVSLVANDNAGPDSYYYVAVTNLGGSSSCTTTVNTAIFGFVQGPLPGPSGTYAYLTGGQKTSNSTENGLGVTTYSSRVSGGNMYIAYGFGVVPNTDGLVFITVNGSIELNCAGYQGPSTATVALQNTPSWVLESFSTQVTTRPVPFAFTIADNAALSDFYAITTSVSGAPQCTVTVSDLAFIVNQILVNF